MGVERKKNWFRNGTEEDQTKRWILVFTVVLAFLPNMFSALMPFVDYSFRCYFKDGSIIVSAATLLLGAAIAATLTSKFRGEQGLALFATVVMVGYLVYGMYLYHSESYKSIFGAVIHATVSLGIVFGVWVLTLSDPEAYCERKENK